MGTTDLCREVGRARRRLFWPVIGALLAGVAGLGAGVFTCDRGPPPPTREEIVERERERFADHEREDAERWLLLRELRARQDDALGPLGAARPDLEGCFDEWASRTPDPQVTTIAAHLSVTPEGRAHDPHTSFVDSASLRLCIEAALARVRYPPRAADADIVVGISWASGTLGMTGHLASAR